MTKAEFLATVAKLYRECNAADSSDGKRNDWMPIRAANWASHLDKILRDMKADGALSAEAHQNFYDDM